MQPIRQIIENMPEFFSVPPEVRNQRVEIIIWPLERQTVQGSFKEALAAMPDIGNDDDLLVTRNIGDVKRTGVSLLNPFSA